DLATVLAREHGGYDRRAGFLDAVRQDPVLSRVKLIAEPWDLGPGGYQLGNWPHPFAEWNDKYRDSVRRFWRGDGGMTPELANRLLGSAGEFDRAHRPATASVNFITAHDGFTLHDLVSYAVKHNEANGEGNRDGSSENFADNMGHEGPTKDKAILAARAARKRAMLATLLLSQGTPMLLAGDEIGNSQNGNNNAYAQDNPIGWVDWTAPDEGLNAFVRRLIAIRQAHPVLRQRHFLHSRQRDRDGLIDLQWRRPDGSFPTSTDWQDKTWRTLCAEIRLAADAPGADASDEAVFCIFNAGDAVEVTLPACSPGRLWRLLLDSAVPEAEPCAQKGLKITAPAGAVLVLDQDRL
ncbi:MAG: glycogen debranching enzyme GlgX, partial [Paracoccaceae bacterium]|nr:glycogen debranching enzyme GlgX [Paracoccaceae bacterium]